MSERLKKVKREALKYVLVGLSLFGGLNAQAKNNRGADNDTSMNVVHSTSVSYDDSMRSYSEMTSLNYGDASFISSNFVLIQDIGNGYDVMYETYGTNDRTENALTMLTPDNREIDLGFYSTDNFMLPSEKIMGHHEVFNNGGGQELLNSSDPNVIKEHNDKWEKQQHILAIKEMQNPEDVQAFMRLVQRDRESLEATGERVVDSAHRTIGNVEDYFMTSNTKEETKDLRKLYKTIQKETESRRDNLRDKAMSGDLTNIASMSNLWNGGMGN